MVIHRFSPPGGSSTPCSPEGTSSPSWRPGATNPSATKPPALIFGGLTVVVSPLIALMKDQVDGLRANGIAAATINKLARAWEQKDHRTGDPRRPDPILYISPERAVQSSFLSLIAKADVRLIAIDEAHCISMWGTTSGPSAAGSGCSKSGSPQSRSSP
ncbi:DEAD/DEAH box helicase [Methanoculleus sp. 10]|uniref:DEAD/DEAH box helicase n=1 Tax=Methanoculleus sp. 10 TaxID=430615 RepID=UPI0025FB5294|nr:DEAD/DEAH box helicase [Methanoculleus sp. 10]